MRRMIITTAATLIALCTAAPASAEFRPADSYPELATILPTARAAWPDSPCLGREEIEITDAFPPGGDTALAGATVIAGRCLVVIRPRAFAPEWAYGLCVALAHEFGHLAGRDHTEDPADLMYWLIDNIQYRPCWEATKPPEPPPVPPPIPAPVVVPFMTLNEASSKTIVLLKRRSHGKARRARCHDGDNATIICRASWRYKRSTYRAIVTLREGGEQIRVSRVPQL